MAEDSATPQRDASVSREEYDRLLRRVERLELEVAGQATPAAARAPAPQPEPARAPPPPRPTPIAPHTPPAPPAPPAPLAPLAPLARPPPATPPQPRAGKPAVSIEAQIGRFAPRIGAVFVFLATLFFLGLAIERGWIGPLAQLGIATATALTLIGIAAWLTNSQGYGTYPQVLEGTGLSIAYATAFVAYAIPYYSDVTRLTEIGGATLMVLVSAAAIGLALVRNSGVIVSLGYALSFTTAGLGWGVLPTLTLPYVAVLGTSLAFVAAKRNWTTQGAFGSLVTGVFFFSFTFQTRAGDLSPGAVLGAAALPFVALTWLALRPLPLGRSASPEIPGVLGAITIGWAALVTVLVAPDTSLSEIGLILFAWAAVGLSLMLTGRHTGATKAAVSTYGLAALAFYVIAAPTFWYESTHPEFATTLTYTAAALGLALLRHLRPTAPRAVWNAGLTLAALAALTAITSVRQFTGDGAIFGTWESWVVFVFLAPSIGLLALSSPREGNNGLAALAYPFAIVYLAIWGFALFTTPFLTTMYLLVLGVTLALGSTRESSLIDSTRFLAAATLALVAIKAVTYDVSSSGALLPVWLAIIEAGVVAGTLHALHHLRTFESYDRRTGTLLVATGAVVIASVVLAYTSGAATSITLALLAVAYLVAGFVGRDPSYRYTSFGGFAFLILRVFTVDLQDADLAVRALVFAVMGGILLAVGYGYARERRNRAARAPATPPEDGGEMPGPR